MCNRFDTFSLQGSIKQSYKRFMFQINDEFSVLKNPEKSTTKY